MLRYVEEVTALARRLTRNAADADDLAQMTYQQAFQFRKTLRDPAACRAWLFRIARNCWIDRFRSETARPQLVPVEEESLAPVFLEDAGRINAIDLEHALGLLPEDQREAVLLCDLWGFSYQEIARITEVPVGTVRSRIARGRARVMRHLSGRGRSVEPESEDAL